MTEVTLSSAFKKAFKKKIQGRKEIEESFWNKVEKFKNNPFDKGLKTHKLSGELKDLWSFSLEYNLRVIFYFTKDENVIFINIGTHDEVY